MKQQQSAKKTWPLLALTIWILPLAGGCVSLERQELIAFVEGLLRNAAAAFLL